MHRRSFIKIITGALAAIPVFAFARPSNDDVTTFAMVEEAGRIMDEAPSLAHDGVIEIQAGGYNNFMNPAERREMARKIAEAYNSELKVSEH